MRNELSGVVVLDKPADISSARAVSRIKRLLGAGKAGHSGTLDPFATGVLVCCINQATRLAQFFLHGWKSYEAVLRLGITTDTQDATGNIVAQDEVPDISMDRLEEVMSGFQGPQMQQPPVFAALKHEGIPLYKLARQGRPVQKPPRPVTIETIRILAADLPDVCFSVTCSAGTYIRTLCADIGQVLGCGGHLAALRRTRSSGFDIAEAATLEAIEDAQPSERHRFVVPMAASLRGMPRFMAQDDLLRRIAQGQTIASAQVPASGIEQTTVSTAGDYLKVVDAQHHLKAVLKKAPDGAGYDYCCVFNESSAQFL